MLDSNSTHMVGTSREGRNDLVQDRPDVCLNSCRLINSVRLWSECREASVCPQILRHLDAKALVLTAATCRSLHHSVFDDTAVWCVCLL